MLFSATFSAEIHQIVDIVLKKPLDRRVFLSNKSDTETFMKKNRRIQEKIIDVAEHRGPGSTMVKKGQVLLDILQQETCGGTDEGIVASN